MSGFSKDWIVKCEWHKSLSQYGGRRRQNMLTLGISQTVSCGGFNVVWALYEKSLDEFLLCVLRVSVVSFVNIIEPQRH